MARWTDPQDKAMLRLAASVAHQEAATLDEPHILLVCDPYSDQLSAYGPFPNPFQASEVGERLRHQLTDDEHACAVELVVIPVRQFDDGTDNRRTRRGPRRRLRLVGDVVVAPPEPTPTSRATIPATSARSRSGRKANRAAAEQSRLRIVIDLGELPAGHAVEIPFADQACNLRLLNPVNSERFRRGKDYAFYGGGLFTVSPAVLIIPTDGHWFVGAMPGGSPLDD